MIEMMECPLWEGQVGSPITLTWVMGAHRRTRKERKHQAIHSRLVCLILLLQVQRVRYGDPQSSQHSGRPRWVRGQARLQSKIVAQNNKATWWISTAVINIMTKSNLGRKGFISFYTSTPQSTIEGQDRNSRKEPGGRNWSRDHGGVAAYWLVWLVFFTIQDHLAQWTGISQFSYLSGNCLEMHPQDNLMEFFNRDSLFPGVHSPCQISRN